jgi:hypothetical protein
MQAYSNRNQKDVRYPLLFTGVTRDSRILEDTAMTLHDNVPVYVPAPDLNLYT